MSTAKTYTNEEAQVKSLVYFQGDELAAKVWVTKYALRNDEGQLLECTPADMHRRIASELFRIERKYSNPMPEEQLFGLLDRFRYIVPQGSPMFGIGNNFQVASLSNCFVIGSEKPADSYGGILKIDQEQVQLMKRRGGVGHDLSHLRPENSPVKNSARTSTGLVPFMERYSNSTREVAQGGRRGALMLSVSIKHPDSESFIDAKLTAGKITGANISVKIEDAFMKAAIDGQTYRQQFPIDSDKPVYVKEIDASNLWKKIIHNAWKSAEPGILFWDTVIRESVPDCYADLGFKTVSTNPCGEIPLCPYDSCRLLAINLFSYVENPFTPQARFDFDLFRKHARYAVRIMDDIIDLEIEKIDSILHKIDSDPEDPETKRVEKRLWQNIRAKTTEGRRTGIGITAEGDMLAAMGLIYGTEDAIEFSVEVHKTLAVEAYRASVKLAAERGPFPIYSTQREVNNPFVNRIREADPALYAEMEKTGRRNIALLTIAPTGTTSLMTQTTSGIEPVFRPYYRRRRKVNPSDSSVTVSFVDETGDSWEEYHVFHHHFITWATVNGYDPDAIRSYSEDQLANLVSQSPYFKATANDVDWVNKVKMQGEIQKWVDHSISVTVNLPSEISEEMVGEVYRSAWEHGCKGVTVYRDGSRDGVLVSGSSDKKAPQEPDPFSKRPSFLEADIIRFKNNHENWIAFVGLKDGKPYEIFTGISDEDTLLVPRSVNQGKIVKVKNEDGTSRYDFQYTDKRGFTNTLSGLSYQFNAEFWNYAKLISGVLRHGMPIQNVLSLVASLKIADKDINSWKVGVERALKKYIPNGTLAKEGTKCPSCDKTHTMVYTEGCMQCSNCGYSKC